MSVGAFHNWEDGSVGIEGATVRIYASRRRRGMPDEIMFTTLAVHPAYLHRVGRPETEDAYGIETICAALAAKVAAEFPDGDRPVQSSVQADFMLEGFSPRREDGNRLAAHAWERLPVPCSREDVDAARARLIRSARESLADIGQYWDDQSPEAWAEMVARSEAEIAAARSHADA